jgi:hypothetical protein
MKGLLETTRSNFSFSDRPRRNRFSNGIGPKALPSRQSFLLEPLESRLLLSVTAVFDGAIIVGGPDCAEDTTQ